MNGKEGEDIVATGCLDDRSHELLQETWVLHQRWPEMMDEINQQAFDVRAIMILISHDHDRSVP
jgi:hypothetical protein